MTNDQAKQILRHCGGNIQLNEDGTPDWRVDLVVKDVRAMLTDVLNALGWIPTSIEGIEHIEKLRDRIRALLEQKP